MLRLTVQNNLKHEKFDINTLKNDIAILKLSEPVNSSPFTQFACLPKFGSISFPDADTFGFIIGWGRTEEKSDRPEMSLKNAEIKILESWMCNYTTNLQLSDILINQVNKTKILLDMRPNLSLPDYLDDLYGFYDSYADNLISESQICAGINFAEN